jgi:hypothetical protein
MSTDLRAIYAAPRHFRASHVPGERWEPFARDAAAYVEEHPDAVIVAATDWEPLDEPLTRATRWRCIHGKVVTDGVRVDITFAPWSDDSRAVRAHLDARR